MKVMEICTNACERHGEKYSERQGVNDKSERQGEKNNGKIAKKIKVTLDSRYPSGGSTSAWHVVVGERYSFEFVYEVTNLMYMYFSARLAICIWKC